MKFEIKTHFVYKLKHALYRLKQAPSASYSKSDKTLSNLGLICSNHEMVVFLRGEGTS